MKSWPKTPLGDAYWFQEGPGVRKWQFRNGGIKLLNVANITKDGVLDLSKTDRHLSEEEVREKYSHFLADAGDLVIASSGISFDDDGLLRTRGAFVEAQHLPLCLNTSTVRFKAKAGKSSLALLRYWLESPEFRGQITRLVTGSAQQNFGPSHLRATIISLPPPAEQERIVKLLDEADELRKLRAQADARAARLIPALFHEMFGGKRRWPTASVAQLAEQRDASIRTGPFGSDLRHSEFVSEGIPVLGIDNVVENEFRWTKPRSITPAKFKEMQRFVVFPGDVLVTIMGTVGRCVVAPNDLPLCISTKHLCTVTLDHRKVEPRFLWASFLFDQNVRQQTRAVGKGAIMEGWNSTIIKRLVIQVPPLTLQREFAARVTEIREMQSVQAANRRRTEDLFQSMLHRAFNGEL